MSNQAIWQPPIFQPLTLTLRIFNFSNLAITAEVDFIKPLLYLFETRDNVELNLSGNAALAPFFADPENWRGSFFLIAGLHALSRHLTDPS